MKVGKINKTNRNEVNVIDKKDIFTEEQNGDVNR
jgi:hypothetical protein